MLLKETMGNQSKLSEEVPSKDGQRHLTTLLLKRRLVKDDIWYVIDAKWYRNFQRYVGLDQDPENPIMEEFPGPIDNSAILTDYGELREHLCEENDFVLVPDELWVLLVKWYGVIYNQKPIARKVVEFGAFTKSYKVEIYLLNLQFAKDFDFHFILTHKFSKSDTVAHIIEFMKRAFRIPPSTPVKLMACLNSQDYTELNENSTVNEEGLYVNQILVLATKFSAQYPRKSPLPPFAEGSCAEAENPVSSSSSSTSLNIGAEGDTPASSGYYGSATVQSYTKVSEYVRTLPQNLSPASSSSSSSSTCFSNATPSQSSMWSMMPEPGTSSGYTARSRSSSTLTSVGSLSQRSPSSAPSTSSMTTRYSASGSGYSRMIHPSQPGICGLSNLGNTCFMNSVIQCMSNCPPITLYFLNDVYQKELNTDNPLGMRGEIAVAFGDLIKTIWSGHNAYTVPHNFKHQVGKFAPQFSGYQQHDSQELLTFLLDGLHEDLNRIRQKPYIELRDADERPDKEVAEESWKNYRRRNDSIIVDVFHGLLKSTVVCPECSKVSITFDPFCYLSLPLPIRRERVIEVTFVPHDTTSKICKYRLNMIRKGTIQTLLTAFSSMTRIKTEHLIVAEIQSHHFHKFYTVNDPLDSIDEKDEIFIYEVPDRNNSNSIMIPVCMWEYNPNQTFNFSQLFGIPIIVTLPKDQISHAVLYDAIIEKLTPFLVSQNDNRLHRLSVDEESNSVSNQLIEHQSEDTDNINQPCNGDATEDQLFTLCVVNPATTSVVFKIHADLVPFELPVSGHTGGQYIVTQWNQNTRQQYYQEYDVQSVDSFEPRHRRSSTKLSLQDCISLYTMNEKLGADDAWYCPTCKRHMCATKKFDLWNLPDILIIHLKRFSYSKYRRDKIDTHVDFPLRELDMSSYVINSEHPPAVYDLIGVCNHYGGMGGGHYTAYAKNRLDEKWYCFDDNSVTDISEQSVVSHAAYVLFYMREGCESKYKQKVTTTDINRETD
ncbi:ubiquitin carboxyl-terminal hydrolase 4-like isoform X2 [Schistocerca gregaria]|uniref:ubiquitin carboxyl-terminal hydrolase 4-like isoform X2 n=1 Tax=Schistocerca gregaria TaxID=7010 RepID=UPI00211EF95C|nr:ubiquitin carboxyl-terminal hydrolase 4-like isoform X2 [Schistocerca gregaria]